MKIGEKGIAIKEYSMLSLSEMVISENVRSYEEQFSSHYKMYLCTWERANNLPVALFGAKQETCGSELHDVAEPSRMNAYPACQLAPRNRYCWRRR